MVNKIEVWDKGMTHSKLKNDFTMKRNKIMRRYNRYHLFVFGFVMASFMFLVCSIMIESLGTSTTSSALAEADFDLDFLPTPSIRPSSTPPPSPTAEVQMRAIQPTIVPPTSEAAVLLPTSMAPLQIPNHPQERNLNCEFRSATDLAAYYGWEFGWKDLFKKVGHDPNGNPYVGFVGRSIDDPPGGIYPAGYGVYAEPVANGLRNMGMNATAYEGQTIEWLKQKLIEGNPIVVWATAGLSKSQVVEWETKNGVIVQGVPHEHTFTAVGYDEAGIYLNDPYKGSTDYYPWESFQDSWALLGNMALTIDEAVPLAAR